MTQPNDPRKVKVIVELIEHASKIAEIQERGDLVERMAKAQARISDPQIRVVIAGQLKQGKSQLLNSLLKTTGAGNSVPLARALMSAAADRANARQRQTTAARPFAALLKR